MKRSNRAETQFAICIKNKGYPASLELRKLYPVIPDASAAAHGQVRIVDESGEDYLYPEEYFVLVKLPQKVEAALQLAS
jgi:hypothetical protein